MTGTTTIGADALTAVYPSHGRPDGGLLEQRGRLVPEPANPVHTAPAALYRSRGRPDGAHLDHPGRLVPQPGDPAGTAAVAVHVAGARAGHFPRFITRATSRDSTVDCQVQLWAAPTLKGLRVRGRV